MPITIEEKRKARHIGASEHAKWVRKKLKAEFPGTRFRVRSHNGGTRHEVVSIGWIDGPPGRAVKALMPEVNGKGWDGSIDLDYYIYRWLLPDGSTSLALSEGTKGNGGHYPREEHEKPHPDAELVMYWMSGHAIERRLSEEAAAAVLAAISEQEGVEL